MIGPHHAIIAFLVSMGHGAAACIATLKFETSYFERTAGSSFSIRMNIVGTS